MFKLFSPSKLHHGAKFFHRTPIYFFLFLHTKFCVWKIFYILELSRNFQTCKEETKRDVLYRKFTFKKSKRGEGFLLFILSYSYSGLYFHLFSFAKSYFLKSNRFIMFLCNEMSKLKKIKKVCVRDVVKKILH